MAGLKTGPARTLPFQASSLSQYVDTLWQPDYEKRSSWHVHIARSQGLQLAATCGPRRCIVSDMPRGQPRRKDGRIATAPQTMRQRAYRHIYELIASGALKGGSALSELSLAEELGSSRTPIREAFGQLIAEGLLEQTPVGTVLVVQLDRQDVHELYELREALEVFAIEKTTRSPLSAAERSQLQQSIDELGQLRSELASSEQATLNTEQMGRFLASDLAFHSLLVSLAHNARIQRVINEMRLLIRIFALQRRGHGLPLLDAILRQHQQILDAVFRGDAPLARALLSEHIRKSLHERLDEFDYWQRQESLEAVLRG